MANIARCGVDTAGGLIGTPATVRTVFVNGSPIACAGDPVAGHGIGIHAGPVLTVTRNVTVRANNIPVVCTADFATCGHPVVSTSNVFITSA